MLRALGWGGGSVFVFWKDLCGYRLCTAFKVETREGGVRQTWG